MKCRVLTEDQLQAIGQYLGKQPYEEVKVLIEIIEKSQSVEIEQKETVTPDEITDKDGKKTKVA